MKQINISVSFDDEKLRALNKYLKKKELTAEDELAAALLHLYEKHVPAAVRGVHRRGRCSCSGKAEAHSETGSAEES